MVRALEDRQRRPDPPAREPRRPVPVPQLRPALPALARLDGREVDFYADEDVERFASAAALRAAYDLVVFPGHTEYVTTRLYDLVTGTATPAAT